MHDRQAVLEALSNARRCLVSMHVSPEGDALGSALALALALKGMGKEALVVNQDPVPRVLDFLPTRDLYRQMTEIDEGYDLLVIVDCGDLERTGGLFKRRSPPIVNIDHHVTNQRFGHINWVDPDASASAEMIADLLDTMKTPITPDVALCIYTALMTETGSFKYSNATPKVFRLAATLCERGVRPDWVASKIYERNSIGRLRLLGAMLGRLDINTDHTVAWATIPERLFAQTGTTAEDTEDFINYPRSLMGVETAVFFRDAAPGTVKVSFRASGDVDVSAVAMEFGGGGHRKAAGCTMKGSIESVRPVVIAAVERVVHETIDSGRRARPATASGSRTPER
jgi:bifunctional oligoribonuclease and PAP phosphatase NrnA